MADQEEAAFVPMDPNGAPPVQTSFSPEGQTHGNIVVNSSGVLTDEEKVTLEALDKGEKVEGDGTTKEDAKAALEGAPGGDTPKDDTTDGDTSKDPKDAPKDDAPKEPLTDDQIRENLQKAGGLYATPEYEPFAIAFERNGDLTEEERAKAAVDLKVDRNMVDAFVDAQKGARAFAKHQGEQATNQALEAQAKATQEIHAVMGGEEAYDKFITWSAEPGNLTPAEAKAYNKALDTDPETAKVLLQGFKVKYEEAGNGAPARDITLRTPKGEASGEVTGYASRKEEQDFINSAEYNTPAGQTKHRARLGKTTAF